ncbi:protein phosphatase 2C domain-containing protein [Streptomyces olivochromogenes]|uniref:protein phosphatase 2C domain-containing protein n=1 Tax=Streptomyces olivochromogenes TaxID=1963 RepID=UPI001F3D39E3|nr:protein phosphatase 2C domain-containing protein [Streptomyces olivochromogenes]MCF3130389.1 protein phosphatase 2C domain-containing protein [Streptomyces olivochromogenes]
MTTTTWLIVFLVLSLAVNAVLTVWLTRLRRMPRPVPARPAAPVLGPSTQELAHLRAQLEVARQEKGSVEQLLRGREQELARLRTLYREAQDKGTESPGREEIAAALRQVRALQDVVRKLTAERDAARSDVERMRQRLAEAEARGDAPFGPDAVSPAIPRRIPLGRDATSDSSVDGADLGPVVVRAASVRGARAREEGEHRRDAFLLRFVEELPTPTLLSAVAAGAPHGRRTQSAADRACRNLAEQVARYGEALGHQLFKPTGSDDDLTALLRTALQGVAHSMRLLTRGEGPEGESDDAALEVALTGLLSRLGDSRQREHVAFGVGDGALMLLRDGTWRPVFTPGTTATEQALRLPAAAPKVRCARLTTQPGDLVALCSAPMAELLLRAEAGDWFATRWAGRQPYLTTFLSEVNVPVRVAGGDRSVVCLWDFGDAREARSAAS